MNCDFCKPIPLTSSIKCRRKRYIMCRQCYVGAVFLLKVMNLKTNTPIFEKNKPRLDELSNLLGSSYTKSSKGLLQVLKWGLDKLKMENELNEKINFLILTEAAYRDHSHTDILVNPGNNGPPTPAHKAILATRSEIFKNMLESDECVAAPKDTITLPDLTQEELDSLLEFLYIGTLPPEKMEKHVHSLWIAADKYEIPYLQKFCEQRMIGSLNISNALDVLEISDVCSNQALKEAVLDFIVKNTRDVVFSPRFDAFALKNPHLSVEITRASYNKSGTNGVSERKRGRDD